MSDKSDDEMKKTLKTLQNDDIVTEPHVGRRSALRTIGATFVGAAIGVIGLATPSEAQATSGVTNRDSGDRPGNGRTGVTNSDSGDQPGYGRRRGRAPRRVRTGRTDRDAGANADGAGYGVCAARGHTDSDSGGGADGAGHGRGPCH